MDLPGEVGLVAYQLNAAAQTQDASAPEPIRPGRGLSEDLERSWTGRDLELGQFQSLDSFEMRKGRWKNRKMYSACNEC